VPKPLLIGIDVGTQGSKGVLASLNGEVLAEHYVEHDVHRPQPGWAEQDADRVWWVDFRHVCQALLASSRVSPNDIGAVACSALMPDMLPLDRHGRPLRTGIIYCDTRTASEVAWLRDIVARELPARPLTWRVHSDTVGPMLLWFRQHQPDLWAQTHKVVDACGYLVFKLTGRYVAGGGNAMGFAPFYDGTTGGWDTGLCSRLEVPQDLLPECRLSTEVVGEVTAEAAAETGLAPGTPVTAGAPDNVAASISVGVVEPGDAGLEYATVFVLRVVTDRPRSHPLVGFTGYVLPATSAGVGGLTTAGALTRWFRDTFGQAERDVEARLGISAYSLLALEAERIAPGSDGLLVMPYFSGNQGPPTDPRSRGLLIGLTTGHGRMHIYRALLEGTGYQVAQLLGWFGEAGVRPDAVMASGGGTRNALWMQIVSDITGVPQKVPVRQVGAPLGNAYLAAYATGQVGDFTPLKRDWVRVRSVLEPDPARHERYQEYLAVYLSLYETNKEFMHRLADIGQRRASAGAT
jgi:xylulokinase